jgi:hypothetical protein
METDRNCICNGSRPWFRTAASRFSHPVRLVAYARAESSLAAAQQFSQIEDYCRANNFELVDRFSDIGTQPGMGFHQAMQQLSHANGLIAYELERFVHHQHDRLLDLKPLLHQFFCSGSRFLVTVKEGVNTQSAAGQKAAIEVMDSLKDPLEA